MLPETPDSVEPLYIRTGGFPNLSLVRDYGMIFHGHKFLHDGYNANT